MKIKKNNGFTLVELLAVIVVLAIILAIAIPQVLKLTEKAKSDAFLVNEKMLVKAARDYAALGNVDLPTVIGLTAEVSYADLKGVNGMNEIYDQKSGDECSGYVTIKLVATNKYEYLPNLSCTSYQSAGPLTPPMITLVGSTIIEIPIYSTYVDLGATALDAVDGEVTVTIDDTAVVETSIGTYEVTYNVTDSDLNEAIEEIRTVKVVSLGNEPELSNNMYPIKWNGTAWVVTTESDLEWYVYNGDIDNSADSNKTDGIGAFTADEWANVHITTTTLTEGESISETDLNMYVWIPRYTYLLNEGSKIVAIKYSDGTTDDTSNSYLMHPGFCATNNDDNSDGAYATNMGDDCLDSGDWNLTGIWVAKFEMSSSTGTSSDFGEPADANVAYGVSRPNVVPWKGMALNYSFNESRTLQTELSLTNVDSHGIKSSEWAAVSYLAEALRDGEEVWINNQGSDGKYIITGCAGTGAGAAPTNKGSLGCNTNYDYKTGGVKAATTGNIYGIYDMSGGSWEYVATYINDNTSGYLTNVLGLKSLYDADAKYKEVFDVQGSTNTTNYNNASSMTRGLGMHETSTSGTGVTSWYNELSYFPQNTSAGIRRSGGYNYEFGGGFYLFWRSSGPGGTDTGWRATLVIE